ncbi:MAG: NAD kinase [Pseudomonadota bacterium]
MQRICVLGSDAPIAQASVTLLRERFGHVRADHADVIVALGGDGFMLQTLHAHMGLPVPVYGMNRGSVGFLMNDYVEDELPERLAEARVATINPLRMEAICTDGQTHTGLAINEVDLFRQTHQAAKIRIAVDGEVLMEELTCDGIMAATPAGSTAYNLSANGPILPIRSKLMALTPISAFRPRRWRGAILPWETHLSFEALELPKRSISATADHLEVRDVRKVEVKAASEIVLRLLYDPGHGLEERLLREQFTV